MKKYTIHLIQPLQINGTWKTVLEADDFRNDGLTPFMGFAEVINEGEPTLHVSSRMIGAIEIKEGTV